MIPTRLGARPVLIRHAVEATRLNRLLFNFAVAVSLALCVATVALWVQTCSALELFMKTDTSTVISSGGGSLAFYYDSPTGRAPASWQRRWFRVAAEQKMAGIDCIIRWHPLHIRLVAPHWAIALLTLLLPACWLSRRLLRTRPPGHCPACGYDLRATPGRCPECGGVPKTVRTSTA